MRLLIVLLLISGIVHAEGKHRPKKLPPNCMIINGQLRCWVIDPILEE